MNTENMNPRRPRWDMRSVAVRMGLCLLPIGLASAASAAPIAGFTEPQQKGLPGFEVVAQSADGQAAPTVKHEAGHKVHNSTEAPR